MSKTHWCVSLLLFSSHSLSFPFILWLPLYFPFLFCLCFSFSHLHFPLPQTHWQLHLPKPSTPTRPDCWTLSLSHPVQSYACSSCPCSPPWHADQSLVAFKNNFRPVVLFMKYLAFATTCSCVRDGYLCLSEVGQTQRLIWCFTIIKVEKNGEKHWFKQQVGGLKARGVRLRWPIRNIPSHRLLKLSI